eukprot:3057771-Prymnesium_polylepis.2
MGFDTADTRVRPWGQVQQGLTLSLMCERRVATEVIAVCYSPRNEEVITKYPMTLKLMLGLNVGLALVSLSATLQSPRAIGQSLKRTAVT